MTTNAYLGEFEHMVLLALLRLGPDAYGVTIRTVIQDRAQRSVSFGAVYATLRRLEQKGFVQAVQGDPTPVRGGRAKKHFVLTDCGDDALRHSQARLAAMAEGLTLPEQTAGR